MKTNIRKPNILLVEDDASLGFVTKDSLDARGYQITWCKDGQEAIETIRKNDFDVFLLDVMLPKVDGLTIAERIREKNKNVPIIFISAKSLTEDKIAGFKVGADDYITKPYNIEELDFRVRVFLKRSVVSGTQSALPQEFVIGIFKFDFKNLTLTAGAQTEHLTLREAEVLRLLCSNVNQVVSRTAILNQIWGSDDYFLGRSLDVFISRLRKYLRNDSSISIDNVHSVGFKLVVKP